MKIQKSEIAAKLSALKSIALSKGTTQTIQGVLFKDNKLTAYNLSIGMTATLSTETNESFMIPPKAIEMIERLPDGELEITGTDKMISLKAAGVKGKYVTTSVADFPEIPMVDGNLQSVTLNGDELQSKLSAVIPAVPDTSTRPVMMGVLLDADGKKLNIVACDGVRLMHAIMDYSGEFNVVVPKAAMQKLLSIGLSGDIEITYTANKALFKTDDFTMFTRLLEGDFLDYNAATPSNKIITEVDRKTIVNSLSRAVLCIDDKALLPIEANFMESEVSLKMHSPLLEYAETLSLEQPVSELVRIGVDTRRFLEVLKAFDDDNVQISLGGSCSPMVLTGDGLSAMLMPVKLKEAK